MSAFCLANCWQLRTSQWLMSKAPVKSQWFFSRMESQLCIYCPSCPPCCCRVAKKFCKKSRKHQKKQPEPQLQHTAWALQLLLFMIGRSLPLSSVFWVVCLLMALLLLNTVTAEAQPHAQPSAARPAQPNPTPNTTARPARPNPTPNTTPNPAQRAYAQHPARPNPTPNTTPNPAGARHARHHAQHQRAKPHAQHHGQTPRPTPRPTQPARPARQTPRPTQPSARSRAKSAPNQAQRAHQCVQSLFF